MHILTFIKMINFGSLKDTVKTTEKENQEPEERHDPEEHRSKHTPDTGLASGIHEELL